jgi:hydroxymethylpyrimidine/phosphomethylpyrimidine kinase
VAAEVREVSVHPFVVTVHALDAGGGEGLVADASVFAELDCRAVCVATSVLPSQPLSPSLVAGQLEAARRSATIGAVRTGYVKGPAQAALIGEFVLGCAPEATVVSWSGLDAETQAAMLAEVVPKARVVVARASDFSRPGGREAADVELLRSAAKDLKDRGARAVLVAGLIVRGRVLDLLDDGSDVVLLDTTRIQAARVDGLTGAHAAALAAHLARGLTLPQAADSAQRYVGFRLRRGR